MIARSTAPLVLACVVACGGGAPSPGSRAACARVELRSDFEVTTPAAAGLDAAALRTILAHAKASDTDAIVILRDGKVAFEEYFGKGPQPIMAMSVAKSVTSLAIASLKMRDASFSLDERVSATFPEWATDPRKARITIRQLMNHTSGVGLAKADISFRGSTEQRLARAPMNHDPGADFRYNNAGVDFLSVLVFAKTKLRLDDLLQRDVFGPIGLRGAYWMKDSAGHPRASGLLILEPIELAKVGQLMLQDGVWAGKRILPEGWVAEVTRPSQALNERYGLLWWVEAKQSVFVTDELLAHWREADVAAATVEKVRALVGRTFDSRAAYTTALEAVLSHDEKVTLDKALEPLGIQPWRIKLAGPLRGYQATGWLGQQLVVFPKSRIVAVRMHAQRDGDDKDEESEKRVHYVDFPDDVRALVGDAQ